MTQLELAFSFALGDAHARRLVWLVRLYCRIARVPERQRRNLERLR